MIALLARFSSPIEGLHREFNALCARSSGGEEKRLGLDAAVGTEGDLVFVENLVAIAHRERGLLPGVAMLRKSSRWRIHVRWRQSACSAILTSSISTSCASCSRPKPMVCTGRRRLRKACSVSGLIPDPPTPAMFSSAIAQQHDCAHRQVRGFCGELLESIVDTGGGSRRRYSTCAVDALDVGVEAIETRLEPILEAGEDPAIEGCECGVFAGTAVDISSWPCCANRQPRRR